MDGTCVLAVEGGYKQAMAGTISLLNKDGDRLHTIYVGSAPESGKKTFLWKMRKELSVVIKEFPKATVVGVADGARDNWEFLNEFTDRHIIDFYHVAGYLNEVSGIISSNDAEKEAWLSSRCHDLKHKPKTADAIIIELKDYLGSVRRTGEEDDHNGLKPLVAIQRVRRPPGKGQPASRKPALRVSGNTKRVASGCQERRMTNNLKPFIAIQRVRRPPSKG
jgi:hypothetical protein